MGEGIKKIVFVGFSPPLVIFTIDNILYDSLPEDFSHGHFNVIEVE